jgi:hypothetical protein
MLYEQIEDKIKFKEFFSGNLVNRLLLPKSIDDTQSTKLK